MVEKLTIKKSFSYICQPEINDNYEKLDTL